MIDLPFQPVTRDLLALVERETGYRVLLSEEPKLPVPSRLQLADSSNPAHRVSYRADGEAADYLICYQCGFVLRLFDNPRDARYVYVPSDKGRAAIRSLVADRGGAGGKSKRGAAQAQDAVTTLLSSLVDRLYGVPVGLRVAEWILDDYPDLEAGQRAAVVREITDAQATLLPEAREKMPAPVFDAMQAINAAQAIYWTEQLGMRELASPFREAGYQRVGRALLDILRDSPGDPGQDRELVNRWADVLHVAGWGAWQRYSAP